VRRNRSVLTVLLTTVLAVGVMTPSGTAAANPPPTTYYLALGDSLARGYPYDVGSDSDYGYGYGYHLTRTFQQSPTGHQAREPQLFR